jgi:hypothetical protein
MNERDSVCLCRNENNNNNVDLNLALEDMNIFHYTAAADDDDFFQFLSA